LRSKGGNPPNKFDTAAYLLNKYIYYARLYSRHASNLPLETIALAVCILDSLNSRFALQERKGCLLIKQHMPCSFGNIGKRVVKTQHIDYIHAELILLSALILAAEFLDDARQTTKEYAEEWGEGLWTCDQINFIQRYLLENLGYSLLPLWEHSMFWKHSRIWSKQAGGIPLRSIMRIKIGVELVHYLS
jgi:hypothetical protein